MGNVVYESKRRKVLKELYHYAIDIKNENKQQSIFETPKKQIEGIEKNEERQRLEDK
ncbi:hypothetical protein ACR782_13305 [Sphingobacterium spiritivorum]|uniref:hypothetical protein n=1 Tax=Sphingobacterium spiritivorum TaxID=258 RepID=UPI003DA3816D